MRFKKSYLPRIRHTSPMIPWMVLSATNVAISAEQVLIPTCVAYADYGRRLHPRHHPHPGMSLLPYSPIAGPFLPPRAPRPFPGRSVADSARNRSCPPRTGEGGIHLRPATVDRLDAGLALRSQDGEGG